MSLTYAIPDIHGRLDLLDCGINKIIRHSSGKNLTIITLGDYVDRGPSSGQVIERLSSWKPENLRIVNLKGNHEAMMWEACNNLSELNWWTQNGGDRTLESYGHAFRADPDLAVVPLAHLNWIADLKRIYVDRHRVFVHAGVDPDIPLHQQNERTLLWKRYSLGFSVGHGRRHVVHGHDADANAPIVTRGRTNLDGLAWKTGRLVIGVFEDDRPGGASEFLEIVCPTKYGL
jgi:serine/threonine protein phosphatase 1